MNNRLKKLILLMTTVLIIAGVLMMFMPGLLAGGTCYTIPVGSYDRVGSPFECPDCHSPGGYTAELRVDSEENGGNVNGTHTDGTLTVTITGDTGNSGSGFSWSSNIPVCYVIVKLGSVDNDGSPFARGYSIPADTYCGTWAGVAGVGGAGISHISFCYDPTTTTTTEGTTTTTEGTTTTTEGTTTTTQGTTTTTQGTTTTTEGTTTTTEGTTTTTGGTTSTTGGTTVTTGGTTVTTTGGEIQVLAFTGFNSLWYVAGSLLIALGIVTGTLSLSTSLKRR